MTNIEQIHRTARYKKQIPSFHSSKMYTRISSSSSSSSSTTLSRRSFVLFGVVVIVAAAAAVVSGFVPSQSISSISTTSIRRPSNNNHHPNTNSNAADRCFASSVQLQETTTTTTAGAAAAATTTLLPDYDLAYQKAVGVVEAATNGNTEMAAPMLHFCKEYMLASQVAYDHTGDEAASATNAVTRITTGLQYATTYGMGPNKFTFKATHEALRGHNSELENGNTIDFYEWGCDFFRSFIDPKASLVLGEDNLHRAFEQIKNGENVIFFANHQSEADPQVMTILMELVGYKKEAENIVYVAGHKVTTDSLAVPFSMGRNLICIHSKKHIDADPDTKGSKTRQNMNAMSGMLKKLRKGGCALWVAPSGGRDRRDVTTGKMPIAPFDSKTIDMFRLMGNKSKKPTHYYPLSMVSYEICPPPDFVEAGTGEQRNFRFTPVGIKIGTELESIGGLEARHTFNDHTFQQTQQDYYELREAIFPGTAPDPEE